MAKRKIIIRDRRVAGWWWGRNEIIDDYGYIIGTLGLSLYLVYCRRSMEQTQSTKLDQEVLSRLLHVRKSTISKTQRLLEWCGLFHVERTHRATSEIFLLDVAPMSPAVIEQIRERVEADTKNGKYADLRKQVMERLDNWKSLDMLIGEAIHERRSIEIITASEAQAALPLPEPAAPSTNGNGSQPPAAEPPHAAAWRGVLERAKTQLPRATFDNWLAGTELVEIDGNTWRIGTDAQGKDMIQGRMLPILERCVPEGILLEIVAI